MGMIGRPNKEKKEMAREDLADTLSSLSAIIKQKKENDLSLSKSIFYFKKKHNIKNIEDLL